MSKTQKQIISHATRNATNDFNQADRDQQCPYTIGEGVQPDEGYINALTKAGFAKQLRLKDADALDDALPAWNAAYIKQWNALCNAPRYSVMTSKSAIRVALTATTLAGAKRAATAYVIERNVAYGVGVETPEGWVCEAWRAVDPITGKDAGWSAQ